MTEQAIIESVAASLSRQLPIDMAIADYDRVRPLMSGKVKPAGISLNVANRYIGDFCLKPVYEAYDVAEMSFSWYVTARSRGEPVIALPIFPLRMPVLAYVFVGVNSPYQTPQDLIGKRIGVSSYRFTVNLWLRGIFKEHYGLSPEQVTWVTCNKTEGAGYIVPPGIDLIVDENGDKDDLERPTQMLERGEVDAILMPLLPETFTSGTSGIRRLFRDTQAESHAYVRRTGFLPATHVMVMSQSLSEREPWICENLVRAFIESQRVCDEFLLADPKHTSLGDAVFFLEQHRAAFASNSWSHGLSLNRPLVETFLRYAHEQGYTRQHLTTEELFPASVLSI